MFFFDMFTLMFGEMIQFDDIFQTGWFNHQLDILTFEQVFS